MRDPDADRSPDRDAERFLFSRIDHERATPAASPERAFKLDRMRRLLAGLSDPQEAIPSVHIAGTKGKGSTAAMTAAALRGRGFRVGLTTSPHLDHFRERIAVGGVPVSAADFADAFGRVRVVVDGLDAAGERATFFEILVATAWVAFRTAGVDVAVLETGLGGRLDATNVCRPVVTAITNVSLDHTQLLGETVEAIAAEKAGIAKSGVPLLTTATGAAADVIARRAEEVGAHYRPIDASQIEIVAEADEPPWRVTITHDGRPVEIPLGGRHQVPNAILALELARTAAASLGGRGAAGAAPAWDGLVWPGRTEVVARSPFVVLDGAHNPAAAAALAGCVARVPEGRVAVVLAIAADKDAAGIIAALAPVCGHVFVTRFVENPRAIDPDRLAEIARHAGAGHVVVAADPAKATAAARECVPDDGLVVITGSLFLVAEARRLIR